MILHSGDHIHLHFWYGVNENRDELLKSFTEMFKKYGIIVGCSTATQGPASFPIQMTVLRSDERRLPS